jgi:ribosomal protein S18 acetylase RimI-like enzyme
MSPDQSGHPAAAIFLRVASADDIDALVAMMVDFNRGELIEADPRTLRPALAQLLADESLGRVWLFEAGGETLGYAVLTFGYDLEFAGRDAFVTEIYLRPGARGKGIGRVALAKMEAEARQLDAGAIHLMVRPENSPAVALYASAGYTSPPRTFLSKRLDGK